MIQEILYTEISDECDVLVCGGGVAGISAALAAARLGKRVILLENSLYWVAWVRLVWLLFIFLCAMDWDIRFLFELPRNC